MIDICLLGTGGMMPLPYRYLTSMMARYNGMSILVDCGEATQIAMKKKGWSAKPIDVMCFTHYHADHISGLPGMLLTMGNAERTEPLLMIGPKGLQRVVSALRVIAPELPFEIRFHELTQPVESVPFGDLTITAFKVQHNVTCYGYSLQLARAGMFQVEKAKALGLPVQFWNPLQKGNEVQFEGKTYTPDMVMGAPRKGIKVTYATDTRPTASIEEFAKDADLLICEGMYGEEEKFENAKEHKHMMMREAARIAAKANPKQLWLTHYSPAMPWPEDHMQPVKEIFPNTVAAKDGQSIELGFEDE
ncbi:MAG: ribonuclease Z [Lachnospiraceae bacterium]|nr:ribonuclease Z [Lachnospiraceae bacterium]